MHFKVINTVTNKSRNLYHETVQFRNYKGK